MKTFLLLFLVIPSCGSVGLEKETIYEGTESREINLKFLKENFDEFYRQNYDSFFGVLFRSEREALNCDNEENTASFLELVNYMKGNAEVNEYYSSIIEERFLNEKSSCFFEGLAELNIETRRRIFIQLKQPTFLDEKEVIAIFQKMSKIIKFQPITQQFFEVAQ